MQFFRNIAWAYQCTPFSRSVAALNSRNGSGGPKGRCMAVYACTKNQDQNDNVRVRCAAMRLSASVRCLAAIHSMRHRHDGTGHHRRESQASSSVRLAPHLTSPRACSTFRALSKTCCCLRVWRSYLLPRPLLSDSAFRPSQRGFAASNSTTLSWAFVDGLHQRRKGHGGAQAAVCMLPLSNCRTALFPS